MVKVIIWTQTAQRVFDSIIEYSLTHADSSEHAKKFFFEVYNQIDKVAKHPSRGRKVTRTKSMQFINFGKHYEMFYRMAGNTLHICNFFDTRQSPNKRPY